MAGTRATWKGVLQISLVTIPIKVYPATEASESLSFNQLHTCKTATGPLAPTPIQQKKWCPGCDREVPTAEIVKGFEFEKGKYVLLLPDELDAVQPPSTRVIELTQFADVAGLDLTYVDRSYYVVPDGRAADEAFVVMRAAMAGLVGVGKLAIYGREYLVALRPQRELFVLHTLHYGPGIVNAAAAIGELPDYALRPAADQLRVARQVIASLAGELRLGDFVDAYQQDLRQIIAAKIAGDEIVQAPPIASIPVVSLQEALVQSLAAVSGKKKTPAKAAVLPKRKRA